MKQLVSSSEAANILGLSLQGIHYRIKKGQLESVKQDGKIYVYIDSSNIKNQHNNNNKSNSDNQNNNTTNNEQAVHMGELALKSKDEQIVILKKTIKFMRRQYTSEIERLDKNQQQILNVFQSEVDLLKSAFSEMKTIYQVEHKEKQQQAKQEVKKVFSEKRKPFMNLKEFFILMRHYNKTDKQIKALVLDRVKNKDKRFIYKQNAKEIVLLHSDFLDLI